MGKKRRKRQRHRDRKQDERRGLAPRRLPGNVSQQAPHNSYGGGPLYYEDREITCVDCGTVEVWTAQQQKWWYETAKGHIDSTAIRCLACRKGTPRGARRNASTIASGPA